MQRRAARASARRSTPRSNDGCGNTDDVDHLALEVNADPPNEGSLRFHARLGFVEVGQQDTPYGIRVSMQMRPVTLAV